MARSMVIIVEKEEKCECGKTKDRFAIFLLIRGLGFLAEADNATRSLASHNINMRGTCTYINGPLSLSCRR